MKEVTSEIESAGSQQTISFSPPSTGHLLLIAYDEDYNHATSNTVGVIRPIPDTPEETTNKKHKGPNTIELVFICVGVGLFVTALLLTNLVICCHDKKMSLFPNSRKYSKNSTQNA